MAVGKLIRRFHIRVYIMCIAVIVLGYYTFYLSRTNSSTVSSTSTQEQQPIYSKKLVHSQQPLQPRESIQSVELAVNFDKKPEVIVYSRTPKAGSKTFGLVMRELGIRNNFHFESDPRILKIALDNNKEKETFVKDLFNLPRPVIHKRHLYFLDIDMYKNVSNRSTLSTYINTVREPLERQISEFYYLRRGAHGDTNQIRRYLNLTETFDECVQKGDMMSTCLYTWEQTRFFCGQDAMCTYPTKDGLQIAKHNLVHKHMAVGIMEDMAKFMEVLEIAHPRFFRNVTGVYNEIAPPGDLTAHHVTLCKARPTAETMQDMKSKMGLDYEFYNFAKQHFYKLYDYLKKTTTKTAA